MMSEINYLEEYKRWSENAVEDKDIAEELAGISGDDTKIEDAFYRNLAFGTGGLRGVIGAGTNRMNIYTVAKASQGLSDYVIKNNAEGNRSIAIAYDSRIKSDLFSKVAAGVFASNGIKTYIYKELMPTPCLSYAVRYLGCSAGIVVTASHNPEKYNGYKVYGSDGCQITTEAATEILAEIEKLDIFGDVKTGWAVAGNVNDKIDETADKKPGETFNDKANEKSIGTADYSDSAYAGALTGFDVGIESGMIEYISDDVYTAFVEEVKKQSVLYGDEINKDVAIIYSPLHGTGLKPVTRTLKEMGYTNITVVPEQELPDGHFTTCPYPNPEIKEAMALGVEYAAKNNADLLLATDPDCDRVGIAVKDEKGIRGKAGEYVLVSGNEVGMLLLDYICSQRIKHGKMPADPVMVKTIVTIDMGARIAEHYGLKTIDVLTGFKFIGEQIGLLEAQGKEDSYIFGFEESYGYLSGGYVRDKDAVDGAFLICEMFAFYKTRGIGILDKLEELYQTYGYCLNTLHSYEFEGVVGFDKMQKIMKGFRNGLDSIGPKKVNKCLDYAEGLDGLPKSDVLKYLLEDNCSVVVRPSGTEPKLKTYISVSAKDMSEAEKIEGEIVKVLEEMLG